MKKKKKKEKKGKGNCEQGTGGNREQKKAGCGHKRHGRGVPYLGEQ